MEYLKKIQHRETNEQRAKRYNYAGIPIFCTGGIHESIFERLKEKKDDRNSSILVLGSGAGAFEKRLIDAGYNNITSVEFNPEKFMVSGPKLMSLDLNNDFSRLGKFDMIVAIEIIEHLENQFHFIRCIKALMKEGSVLYISTPSVENKFARIKYLLVGRLNWFSPEELESTGHINPIFTHILRYNLQVNDLKVDKFWGNSNIWEKLIQHDGILYKIIYSLTYLMSLFIFKGNNYEINLFEITSSNYEKK